MFDHHNVLGRQNVELFVRAPKSSQTTVFQTGSSENASEAKMFSSIDVKVSTLNLVKREYRGFAQIAIGQL
jgi:hypothetical protein